MGPPSIQSHPHGVEERQSCEDRGGAKLSAQQGEDLAPSRRRWDGHGVMAMAVGYNHVVGWLYHVTTPWVDGYD